MYTPARLCVYVGIFRSTHAPTPGHSNTPPDPPRPLTDPASAQGAELREGANQSLARHERGAGLAHEDGGGRGYWGRGLRCPSPRGGLSCPKQTWRLFTCRPGSANGRAPCGQLRRRPTWRRRGAAVPGRCCRALPRRGAPHRLRVWRPVPGRPLVPGRCILLGTKKRTLWSVSSGFSVSAHGVGTGSWHRPACLS